MSREPERLVEQAALRDEQAIELLLEKYLPTVQAIVRHRMSKALRSREESLDLVQSACLRALEQSRQAAPADDTQFRAWLLRIVETKLVDRYRELTSLRRGYDQQASASEEWTLDEQAGESSDKTPSLCAAQNETRIGVRKAIAELPIELGEALHLHEFEGLSYEEVARRIGITLKQARYRVTKAKIQIAPVLGRLEPRDAPSKESSRG